MQTNVGKTDRIVRVIIGTVIVAVGAYNESWWGAVGLIPLVTAAIGWCPLYCPLHFSTIER